jgi:hypothetical protein
LIHQGPWKRDQKLEPSGKVVKQKQYQMLLANRRLQQPLTREKLPEQQQSQQPRLPEQLLKKSLQR